MFLGCDLPIQLLLKSLSNAYDDRLVDGFHHVPIHVMNYELCNILFNLATNTAASLYKHYC